MGGEIRNPNTEIRNNVETRNPKHETLNPQGDPTMPKLRPLGDKILVKRVEAESKTKSGNVLPDTAKEKPKRGKILAVGDGKRLDNGERAPVSVKKGDEVIFTSYAGTEIKLDGEELMIMSEDDVLAVVE
jgi:chaperonin GroES